MVTTPSTPVDPELYAYLVSVIGDCYAGRPRLNPWEYARERVWLGPQATADPGFFDPDLTPFTKRMQELGAAPAIDPLTGHFVHTYVAMKSSRTGFTEGGLNIIRWMPENQPGHALYAIDSVKEARGISRERLKPTIEKILGDSATLPTDPDAMGTLEMYLDNMTIRVAGSYAEGTFANKWLRKCFLDEYEVGLQELGESTPLDLARSRGTTVDDFQLFVLSKPKRTGTRFHKEYLNGTQEKYFVPCPHCGTFQELIWDNVRFDNCRRQDGKWDLSRVAAETWYRCAGPLQCRIEEKDKRWMISTASGAHWRIANLEALPGYVSQHISDLYSPFAKVSWGQLALIWLSSQHSIAAIQHFHNNHLGLPFEEAKMLLSDGDLIDLRSGQQNALGEVECPAFGQGELPWIPTLLLATSDVQDGVFKWGMWAFKGAEDPKDIAIALVDYGETLAFKDLENLIDKEYRVRGGDGTPYSAGRGLVDSGWDTFKIYEECQKSGRWFPTKGIGGAVSGDLVILRERSHNGEELIRYDYVDEAVKFEFYGGRIKRKRHPRLFLFANIADPRHEKLRKELQSEHQTIKDGKLVWDKGPCNDWGDMGKMGAVVGYTILVQDIIAMFLEAEEEREAELKKRAVAPKV